MSAHRRLNRGSDKLKRIAVVTPLNEERAPIARRVTSVERVKSGSHSYLLGGLAGTDVVLAATGDGSEAAQQRLAELLDSFEVEAVVTLGIAGGLSPDLEVGTIVVAKTVQNGLGQVVDPDAGWLERASHLEGVAQGTVLSRSDIAVDARSKARLHAELSASGAAVVDLESAAYGREASRRGLPYLVARAVSDTSEETLPLDFNRFRSGSGRVDRRRVAVYTLVHPQVLPHLLSLRRRVRLCAERLADFAEGLLTQ